MSDTVFPTFSGKSVEMSRKPIWSNTVYRSDSGKRTVNEHWSYPIYQIRLLFNFMTDNAYTGSLTKGDIETLQGFINTLRGEADTFLYLDPVENTETDQAFGVGDGVETEFQLVRSLPTWSEPVRGVVGTPTIYIDDVETEAFTVDSFGVVTFTAPPTNTAVLTWSGQYYFRCCLTEMPELPKTTAGIYENITINMESVK